MFFVPGGKVTKIPQVKTMRLSMPSMPSMPQALAQEPQAMEQGTAGDDRGWVRKAGTTLW